jgi:large subunit ribosomal protein L31e
MAEEKLERIYTVPLAAAFEYKRTNRVPRAVKVLRQFISRHMKTDMDSVLLSNALNNSLWERSIQKPPRRVKVRAIRKEGVTHVYLPDEATEDEKKAKKDAEEKARKEAEKAKTAAPAAKPAAAAIAKPVASPASAAKPAAPAASPAIAPSPARAQAAEPKKQK